MSARVSRGRCWRSGLSSLERLGLESRAGCTSSRCRARRAWHRPRNCRRCSWISGEALALRTRSGARGRSRDSGAGGPSAESDAARAAVLAGGDAEQALGVGRAAGSRRVRRSEVRSAGRRRSEPRRGWRRPGRLALLDRDDGEDAFRGVRTGSVPRRGTRVNRPDTVSGTCTTTAASSMSTNSTMMRSTEAAGGPVRRIGLEEGGIVAAHAARVPAAG